MERLDFFTEFLRDKVICDVIHIKSVQGGIGVQRNEKDCSEKRAERVSGGEKPLDGFSNGLSGECVFSVCIGWHFRD